MLRACRVSGDGAAAGTTTPARAGDEGGSAAGGGWLGGGGVGSTWKWMCISLPEAAAAASIGLASCMMLGELQPGLPPCTAAGTIDVLAAYL